MNYPNLRFYCAALICLGTAPTSQADPENAGPSSARQTASRAELIARGRAQFLAGETAAAIATLEGVLAADPEDREARTLLQRIAAHQRDRGALERETTRELMLHKVEQSWRPTSASVGGEGATENRTEVSALERKLDAITIPTASFNGVDLSRVVATLAAAATECDHTGLAPRGVNIVLLDASAARPAVTIELHDLPLRRVLDFVTAAIGYQWELQGGVVVLRSGGARGVLETAIFPVSRSTAARMSGAGRALAPAEKSTAPAGAAGNSTTIRNFLQEAGVRFDTVEGSSLVYDGAALLVTQSRRNLDRIHQILVRYAEVRQVEIEAKFMEVQEGALEELGINWTVSRQRPNPTQDYATSNRSLATAFASNLKGGAIIIDGQPAASVSPPSLPGVVPLGEGATPLAQIDGFIGDFDVNAVIRALSQKQGSELLSAPKVTVLSGNVATITIAQQLRYPRQYGQIQSQVGQTTSSGQSTGSAGVTITAGTPQDFTTENVGVDLSVTPAVEEDGRSITLDLHPVVTEFEGFVEYGGPSLAISGGRTVTIPSGFYQPIFSRRELSTRVTLWDGATLVMGGLTREEGRNVKDKVPLLGDLPAVGRLFRSQGTGSAKRSLLIFVTASLVNPGGALKKQVVARGDTPPGAAVVAAAEVSGEKSGGQK